MPDQKNRQKQDKNPAEPVQQGPMRDPGKPGQPMRDPQRKQEQGDEDKKDQGNVIVDEDEVEVDVDDLEDEDSEGDRITGRHPSQRDRDPK